MPKRVLRGVVTSNTNDQTVTVQVERRFTHPIMKKTIRKTKKYRAHDENNESSVGDMVKIQECAPRSKTKAWEVLTES
jgi:small subunit ribosomal protein S17